MRRFAWLLMLLTVAPAAAEPFAPKLVKELGTSRFRYPGHVAGSVVSPDGKYIAVRGDSDVWVYEFATGRNVWRSRFKDWDDENIQQSSLPVFDSANNLLTVEFNADIWPRVATYCIASGKLLRTARIKLSRIRGTFFSPDATLLAVRRSREVIVLDARTGVELYRIRAPGDSDSGYARIKFSPDSRRVAVSWDQDRLYVFDRATGSELLNTKQISTVVSMAFSLDSECFHFHQGSSTVVTIDLASGARSTSELSSDCEYILGLRGDHIVGISRESRKYHLHSTIDKKLLKTFTVESIFDSKPSVTPDGQTLVAPSYDSEFGLWDLATGRRLPQSADGASIANDVRFFGREDLLVMRDDEWYRYNFPFGSNRKFAGQSPDTTRDLSPDGKLLVNATDQSVTIVEAGSGKSLFDKKYRRKTNRASVQFLDGGRSVGILNEFEVAIWNFAENCTSRLSLPEGKLKFDRVFSPSGTWLVSRPAQVADHEHVGGNLEIRELPSGRIRAEIHHEDYISQTIFTRDETRLIYITEKRPWTISDSLTVHIVEPATGKCLRRYLLKAEFSKSISPDGRVMYVIKSGDKTEWITQLQAIEIATGRVRFETPSAAPWIIHGVGCAPDLRRVAVGTSDGLVRVWDTAPDDGAPPPDAAAWEDLRDAEAAKGYAAILRFAKYPAVALSLLKAKLPPEPKTDPAAVAGWLRDLGAPAFRTREDATKNLAASLSAARTAMETTLATTPSPEVRERLTGLLECLPKPRPDEVRAIRAAEIVERILADERTNGETRRAAIELLNRWAGGADGATLTTEAKETLNRMKR